MGNDRWGAGGGGCLGLSRERCKQHYKHMFFFVYCSLLPFFVLAFLFIRGKTKTNKQKNGQVLNKPQMRLLPISSNGVCHTTIQFHVNPQ